MNPIAIIYRSKYGATRTYANWLQQALSCELLENRRLRAGLLAPYDTVVLCGGIYAGGIAGFSFLRQNITLLQDKKLAVFAVGASPYDEKAIAGLHGQLMQGPLQKIPLFYGRGAWNEKKMSVPDRALCSILQRMVAKTPADKLEPWMAKLLTASGQSCDWTDKKYLAPLLQFLSEKAILKAETELI